MVKVWEERSTPLLLLLGSLWSFIVSSISQIYLFKNFPVGWSCRIHWLHLCRGLRPPPPPTECPGYDTKQSYAEVPVMLELWGMQSTSSLPSLSGPLWPKMLAPDRVLSMGQIELNCIFMLNWIAWNRTVLTFALCTYAKLNCLKWNCFCMLNWIVWNRTVFDIETVLMLNWIVWNCFDIQLCVNKNYSYTKLNCLK